MQNRSYSSTILKNIVFNTTFLFSPLNLKINNLKTHLKRGSTDHQSAIDQRSITDQSSNSMGGPGGTGPP